MHGRLVLPLVFVGSGLVGAMLVLLRPSGTPSSEKNASPVATVASAEQLEPAVSSAPPHEAPPTPADQRPPMSPDCPAEMVLVDAYYCPFVAHRCQKQAKPSAPGREGVCESYYPEVMCEGTLERLRYCVDAYEYPNQRGALPVVLVDFDQARSACEAEGKRLCSLKEWSLACEGEMILPLSSGLTRDAANCPIDRGPRPHLAPTLGSTVAAAFAKLDRRSKAGAHPICSSPFGVADLLGNVAEWVEDPQGGRARPPFVSVAAGGDWGSEEVSCRTRDDQMVPSQRAAGLGFRCCAEPIRAGPLKAARKKAPGRGFAPIAQPP